MHFEVGRRPRQPALPGKVVRESKCGLVQAMIRERVDPPYGGFFVERDFIRID